MTLCVDGKIVKNKTKQGATRLERSEFEPKIGLLSGLQYRTVTGPSSEPTTLRQREVRACLLYTAYLYVHQQWDCQPVFISRPRQWNTRGCALIASGVVQICLMGYTCTSLATSGAVATSETVESAPNVASTVIATRPC